MESLLVPCNPISFSIGTYKGTIESLPKAIDIMQIHICGITATVHSMVSYRKYKG